MNTLVYKDDKKTEYWVDREQHEAYVAGLFQKLEDNTFLNNFHVNAQAVMESILEKMTGAFSDVQFGSLTNEELLNLYEDIVHPNVEQFYVRMWTVFNIGAPLAEVVDNELTQVINDVDQRRDALLQLSSPLEPNDVTQERIDLLTVAVDWDSLDDTQKRQRIVAHTDKYKHIPLFDFDHAPYSVQHFLDEMEQIDDPQTELDKIKAGFAQSKQHYRTFIDQTNLNERLEALLAFLKENVCLRDYRDMIRQKLNLQLRTFYTEVGKRIGLSVEQIALLTNAEIASCLQIGKAFDAEEIKMREEAYLLIQKEDEYHIFSGEQATEKAKQEISAVQTGSHDVKGKTGSKGTATGQVKIIFTNKDLGKVEKGDVLVTAMTRQDFVPYLRKVSAIVTDEGSVTCHAAIISRELGIPCIVATGNGTTALKDGDTVEVDANRGIVRKL
ncbi:MAG: hypothetical protein COU35_02490 [Candidatus Magasanikbacteria bacterium CG10_big_fil_rev_8_21_14_0_10_47_10]|uniref:PEP-utilising enzyme mobile domain-containing protein n=1 Tax=Candidatus Magasanikbacteria bacterium CG10_big_fil_rev_8_21_14_0_10_47_10 TaxID=1974652 RepID=A0A2H0TQP3_9BACT|nr:MAG: hypothetical protein COU35_02490 [Candidatus Magasanikbacteria bacterium CG10_big_fil_rev_8_21_14_0_10_47_10]